MLMLYVLFSVVFGVIVFVDSCTDRPEGEPWFSPFLTGVMAAFCWPFVAVILVIEFFRDFRNPAW